MPDARELLDGEVLLAGGWDPAHCAVKAVLDLADTMDSNADFMDADGADPMVAHQKRHNAYCVRNAITTALKGEQQ